MLWPVFVLFLVLLVLEREERKEEGSALRASAARMEHGGWDAHFFMGYNHSTSGPDLRCNCTSGPHLRYDHTKHTFWDTQLTEVSVHHNIRQEIHEESVNTHRLTVGRLTCSIQPTTFRVPLILWPNTHKQLVGTAALKWGGGGGQRGGWVLFPQPPPLLVLGCSVEHCMRGPHTLCQSGLGNPGTYGAAFGSTYFNSREGGAIMAPGGGRGSSGCNGLRPCGLPVLLKASLAHQPNDWQRVWRPTMAYCVRVRNGLQLQWPCALCDKSLFPFQTRMRTRQHPTGTRIFNCVVLDHVNGSYPLGTLQLRASSATISTEQGLDRQAVWAECVDYFPRSTQPSTSASGSIHFRRHSTAASYPILRLPRLFLQARIASQPGLLLRGGAGGSV